jgi:hypothetical protein
VISLLQGRDDCGCNNVLYILHKAQLWGGEKKWKNLIYLEILPNVLAVIFILVL